VRLVIVGPVYPYRGGIAHYTARLAQELAKGHQVSVLSFRKQFPAWLYPGVSDKDPSQKTLSTQASYLLEPLNPLAWRRSAAWIESNQPDLVVIQWWVTFWSPAYSILARFCRSAKIPVVYLIHNVLPHEGGWIHRPLARLALGQGRRFIVHTPEQGARLQKLLPGARPDLCPFPVYDMLSGQERLSKTEARRQLSLPEKAPLLLFFGIVRPYKGLRVLLDALGCLVQSGERVHLVVAGEFWEDKSAYLAQIEALNLSGLVHLEDRYIRNEELPGLFAAADIAVAPYTNGTQSAVAALALGFGIPLITTNRSAAGLDALDRERVRVIPAGDPKALAEAIRTGLKNLSNLPDNLSRPVGTSGWETLGHLIETIQQEERL
jgi:glycosyltransferase involved in cell wall biosynthesis